MPWAHDRSIASAPRGEMKSLDLNEINEFILFSHDFSKSARAVFVLKSVGAKTLGFYMFSRRVMLTSLRNVWFWKDFDMRARRSAHDDFVVFFCKGLLAFAVLR